MTALLCFLFPPQVEISILNREIQPFSRITMFSQSLQLPQFYTWSNSAFDQPMWTVPVKCVWSKGLTHQRLLACWWSKTYMECLHLAATSTTHLADCFGQPPLSQNHLYSQQNRSLKLNTKTQLQAPRTLHRFMKTGAKPEIFGGFRFWGAMHWIWSYFPTLLDSYRNQVIQKTSRPAGKQYSRNRTNTK